MTEREPQRTDRNEPEQPLVAHALAHMGNRREECPRRVSPSESTRRGRRDKGVALPRGSSASGEDRCQPAADAGVLLGVEALAEATPEQPTSPPSASQSRSAATP